jgi:TolB-like protein/Flp pilus assembly protein TadD
MVALGLGAWLVSTVRPWPRGGASVAVLPFADLSEAGDQAWLADGIAEELLHSLAALEGLRVAGRTSSFRFRGRTGDLGDIGAQLRVSSVVEGSVRRAGDRIRVSAELVDVAGGAVVWSETYDRTVGDLFAMEEEIARAVAGGLRVALLDRGPASGVARPTRGEAQAELLRGRHLARRGTEADHRAALQALEHAVALDPGSATALAELAMARLSLLPYLSSDSPGWEATMAETRAASRAAAERAIALAPGQAAGWLARSQLRLSVDGDWPGASGDLDRALQLDPRDLDVRFQHARASAQNGRLAAAISEMQGVFRDDPLSANAATSLGAMYAAAGRYAESRATLERALAIEPRHAKAVRNLCATEILDGRAERALELAGAIGPEWARRHVQALAYHALGRDREAREELAWLSHARWNQFQVAELHAWLGDRDAAFASLERAVEVRDMGIFHAKYDPFLETLHADRRFADLLRRVGLPPE